jgi:type I restriction enzyme S subunit
VREGWTNEALENVCYEITDGSHFSPKTQDSGYPYITVRDIDKDQIDFENCKFIGKSDFSSLLKNGCKPNKGDILFSKDGTVGKVALVNQERDFVILSSLAILRPDNRLIDSTFLKYVLKSSRFLNEAVGKKTGVAIRRIILRNLKAIHIPVPPLLEQKRIVAILDEAFEGIDVALANAEKNLANARELYERYLNSVLTQKGEAWLERKLGECFRLKSGDNLTSKAMNEGAFPVFGGNGIAGMHNEFNLSGDNVIIGRVGALCGNARHITDNIWLTDNAFRIVDFEVQFDNAFLTYLLNFKNLRGLARQSAQPVISNNSLKDLLLNFPESVEEQQCIVAQLDALSSETQRLEAIYQQKLDGLAELKQAVLQKAFAGELTAQPEQLLQEAVA